MVHRTCTGEIGERVKVPAAAADTKLLPDMAHTLSHKNVSKHNTGGVILITSEHATPAWAQEGREAAKTFLSASRPANRKLVAGFNSGWWVGLVAQITRGRARCPFLMVHHNTFCVITSYCLYICCTAFIMAQARFAPYIIIVMIISVSVFIPLKV